MSKPIVKNVKIPFSGFYESDHAHEIEHEIEMYFDREGGGRDHTPENFWYSFNKMRSIESEYAALYVRMFRAYFEDETGIELPLQFELMTSPREYNFETDRIFCDVKLSALRRVYQYVDKNILAAQIKERCTSYDGFISFYSNDAGEWVSKPLAEWDHNELGILIEAALITGWKEAGHEPRRGWEWDVMEYATGDGLISDIVYPYLDTWCKENPLELDGGRVKAHFDIPDSEWDELSEDEREDLLAQYEAATYRCEKTLELPLNVTHSGGH